MKGQVCEEFIAVAMDDEQNWPSRRLQPEMSLDDIKPVAIFSEST